MACSVEAAAEQTRAPTPAHSASTESMRPSEQASSPEAQQQRRTVVPQPPFSMAFVSTMRAALQARESVDSVGCKAQRRIAAATVISLHVASARHDRYVRHGDSAENKLLDRELSDACCWSAVKGECWMDRADQLDKEDAPALVFTALSFDNTILGLVVASVAVIPSVAGRQSDGGRRRRRLRRRCI